MTRTAYITSISANTTLSIDYDTYIINISSDITVTLPNITCDGICINLIRVDVTNSIVTVDCLGGQLINGSATTSINFNGDILFVSLDDNWVTVNTISAISIGENYVFPFFDGTNPYKAYVTSGNNGTANAMCDFYYPGSNFNGGVPTIFTVIFSIPGTGVYKFDLLHLKGGTGVTASSVIATITTSSLPSSPTILTTSTITTANISTTECMWEIRVTKLSGNLGIRVYNCFIGL